MTDDLRSRLAADGVVGPQAALILTMAHDLPAGVEVWATTSTVAELAARLETSPRTVQRLRAQLPELPYLSITSTSRGYMLRVALDGGAVTPPPKSRQDLVSPLPDPRQSPATPPPSGDAVLPIEALYDLIEWAARVADLLPDDAQLPPSLAALVGGRQSPVKGVTNPRQTPARSTTHPRQIDDTSTSNPRQSPATSHAHARTDTPRAHAPVILQRDSLRSSLLSEQAGQPGARVGVHAHEGAHTHEACQLAEPEGQVGEDDQEQLVAWLSVELEERTEDITRGEAMPKPKAIARTARLLLSRLERLEVAQAFVQQRFADLATRRWETLPSDRRTLLDWLGKDSANAEQRALALAAVQPATLPASAPQAAAQPAAYVAPPRGRRAKFRAPQFAEAFEAIAQPVESVEPEQERQSWREQLRVELSMPSHHRQDELVALLVERLGDEGQQLLKESQDPPPTAQLEPEPAQEPATEHVDPLESDASSDQLAEPEAPDDVQEAPSAPEPLQTSAAAAPSETAKASGSYAPFPFAQLSQELGYNRSAPKQPEPCLDVAKLWPSLLDAVRAHGPRGHSVAQLLDEAKTLELDVEAQQLRVGLEDEAFVAHLMGFDMLPYRVALLERLELRTTKPGWRLIAHLAQSQEEAG